MGRGKMDFVRLDLYFFKDDFNYQKVEKILAKRLRDLFFFIRENYNLVTLSIESNHRGIYGTVHKRMEYVDFIEIEFLDYFSSILMDKLDERESREMFKIIRRYEYIFQIHDSLKDLTKIKRKVDKRCIDLKDDLLLMIRELSGETLTFFNKVSKAIVCEEDEVSMKEQAKILQERIDTFNGDILKLISQPGRKDAGIILRLMSYSRRLQDKLISYYKLFD